MSDKRFTVVRLDLPLDAATFDTMVGADAEVPLRRRGRTDEVAHACKPDTVYRAGCDRACHENTDKLYLSYRCYQENRP